MAVLRSECVRMSMCRKLGLTVLKFEHSLPYRLKCTFCFEIEVRVHTHTRLILRAGAEAAFQVNTLSTHLAQPLEVHLVKRDEKV